MVLITVNCVQSCNSASAHLHNLHCAQSHNLHDDESTMFVSRGTFVTDVSRGTMLNYS